MKWTIIVVMIVTALTLFLMGCARILNETEEIQVKLKCGEVTGGAMMLGMTTDEAISEICKEACLGNSMKYSNSYKCNANSNNLVCDCIITPERKEQLKAAENLQKQKELEDAAWKAQNPGKLTDDEAKSACVGFCAGAETAGYANDLNMDAIECQCRDGKHYIIDSKTEQQISMAEFQRRIEVYKSTHPQPSPPTVPEEPPPTTIEDMWNEISLGMPATKYYELVQTPGFEWIEPPWASTAMERLQIRKSSSDGPFIQLYFPSQALWTRTIESDTQIPSDAIVRNGVAYGYTNVGVIRKSLFQNGTLIKTEPS